MRHYFEAFTEAEPISDPEGRELPSDKATPIEVRNLIAQLRHLTPATSLILAISLAGCVGAPQTAEAIAANDPFEATNRETLKLNEKIENNLVRPTIGMYFSVAPSDGRRIIHDFIENVSLPTVFINDVLQGETKRAGQTLARFTINSTVGLGGLFDPATNKFGVPNHDEDFGQTLAVWGVGEGPYLILPLFGPQPPRDAFGRIVDTYLDPLNHIFSAPLLVGPRKIFRRAAGSSRADLHGVDRH